MPLPSIKKCVCGLGDDVLAVKLNELERFENFAANNQFRKQKRVKMTPKSN